MKRHQPALYAAPLSRRTILASSIAAAVAGLVPLAARSAQPMRIGVIGAGSLGGTVGRLWVQAGHEVRFASRHPEELTAMTRQLGPRASAGTPQQAAEFGSTLLFAVPYEALAQLGRDLQADLRGKVVLDACNPSATLYERLVREMQANSVAEMSTKLLPGTRLVRAFSAVDATSVAASAAGSTAPLGVPLAGDDASAVESAAQLVRMRAASR